VGNSDFQSNRRLWAFGEPLILASRSESRRALLISAGIDAEMRAHCAKAGQLLATLPTQADPAVKKQIVEASLNAFGVPIAKIIEAGVHEVQALEGYIQADARDRGRIRRAGNLN